MPKNYIKNLDKFKKMITMTKVGSCYPYKSNTYLRDQGASARNTQASEHKSQRRSSIVNVMKNIKILQ